MDEALKKISLNVFRAPSLDSELEGVAALQTIKDSRVLHVRCILLNYLSVLFNNCFKFINFDNIDKQWSIAFKLSSIRGKT